ncbi:MAG: hypothetical protein IH594_00565 [Bacteroidales bacterium]|nr:hypothetical protein [Bacteroidales bacterium]
MANNFLKEFPSRTELLDWYNTNGSNIVHEVNGHFHTPYSYSAFRDMRQVFEMARSEHIKILGINDFYTMAGYEEFHDLSIDYKTFPLFNIEFMGLLKDEQKNDIRVNDPNNPGRIYFSGKGLDYPVSLEGSGLRKLEMIREESANQTREMFRLAAEHLVSIDSELTLDYEVSLKQYTRGMMRERHIAKILRELIFDKYKDDESRNVIFQKLYRGKEPKAKCGNSAAVEDEIRSRLLKKGGIAYVQEDSKAFLELDEINRIILDAGGIPTYPVLLDDKNGDYTDYERNSENLYNELSARNIYSLELIPGRNDFEHLKEFVLYFHDRGFILTFGTEHNTPELIPLKIFARGGKPLDEELKRINFEGACIISAHQYLRAKEEDGYVDKNGKPRISQKEEFIELGNAVIEYFLQN